MVGAQDHNDAALAYLQAARATLDAIAEQQLGAIHTAAAWVANTVSQGGLLFITGSGHSHMIAEEVFYRAGGLIAVNPILASALMLHEAAARSSALERLEGLAEIHIQDAGLSKADILVIASNSGRNAFPVEAALVGKRTGCKVIALTSLQHSKHVSSRHSSGKRLFEIADLVLDTCVGYGDAAIEVPQLGVKVGPLSTVAGAALINAVIAQATWLMVERGQTPEVFASANLREDQQAPAIDLAYWRQRIRKL
jgi:uncharacterized phosphosugar-binding protein